MQLNIGLNIYMDSPTRDFSVRLENSDQMQFLVHKLIACWAEIIHFLVSCCTAFSNGRILSQLHTSVTSFRAINPEACLINYGELCLRCYPTLLSKAWG
jgi:hypothetical protein